MTKNRLLYAGLRAVARVMPFVPLRLLYALSSLGARVAFHLNGSAREGVVSNLSVVFDAPKNAPLVQKAARDAFVTDARNWVDTLRIARLSAQDISAFVDVEGWEHVERAIAGGRGAIVVTVHLGNFDLVGQVFAARGIPVTIPVERVEPSEFFDFLMERRRSQGINVVPIEKAPWAMLHALRRGEVVAIAADRQIAGRAMEVPFFGAPARLPTSPAALARRHRSPVIIAVGTRLPGGGYHGLVLPAPLHFSDDESFDERENTRRILSLLEPLIRRHAGQWLAFEPVWSGNNGTGEAATIGQQTGTAR
ncbi:MAG: lysophospholipid acyltransferase family protein [Chloroflexota bacterium]